MDAYNRRDAKEFATCLKLPLTAMFAPPDGVPDGGLPVVTAEEPLAGFLPAEGDYSDVDAVEYLHEIAPFEPVGADVQVRGAIVATFTRRHADRTPHRRMQDLYVLSDEGGQLGIKVAVQLALEPLG
jgi:hypothetical protein